MRLRLDGRSYSKTFQTEREAVLWAQSLKARHVAGELAPRPSAEDRTMRSMMNEYIREMKDIYAENTLQSYVTASHHFGPAMDMAFKNVQSWQKVINRELAQYNPNTVDLMWQKLTHVMRYNDIPVPEVSIPKKKSKLKEYLTPDEIPVFLSAIRGHRHEALFLMMLSSMRVSEALHVKQEDITAKGIHVRGTKTDAADRQIPWIIPRLRELLMSGKDLPITKASTLNVELKRVCERNGLPVLTNHSLRISACSLMYSLNVPERVCMRIGGWSDVTTMHRIYVRISDDDVSKYADTMTDYFTRIESSLPV